MAVYPLVVCHCLDSNAMGTFDPDRNWNHVGDHSHRAPVIPSNVSFMSLTLFLYAEDGFFGCKDAGHGLLEVPKFQVGSTHLS